MSTLLDSKKPLLSARVSPDQKYLFFSSEYVPYLPYTGEPLDYEHIVEMFRGPQNGTEDLYWVDAGGIDQFRTR